MLLLGPDEVVAGIGHGAVGFRIGGAEQRAAHDFLPLHHLELDRVPDLGAGRRVPGVTVFPLVHVELALIHGARRGPVDGMAVLARLGGEGKLSALGDFVFRRLAESQCADAGSQGNRNQSRYDDPLHETTLHRISLPIRSCMRKLVKG